MNDQLVVGLIQSDLHWENTDANLAMFEEKIWQFESPLDVVVLPEMFTTGFSMDASKLSEPMNSKTFRWMKQVAAQAKSLIIGSYIIKEQTQYYNRLFCVFPNGQFQYYDKRHLFSLAGEGKNYTAGKERLIIEWKGWRILPLICYDLRFPVWSRSQNYEYDLLVYIANWPTPRVNAWDTLLQARAIENQSYVVGVNRIGEDGYGAAYNGHSAVIDYLGNSIAPPSEEACLTVRTLKKQPMQEFRNKYNFQLEADRFKIMN
ncbi:MAG: amidohydrolase [Bacteroidota bacterium]